MSGDLEMANLGWIVRGQGRKDILKTLKSQDRTGRIGLHLGLPALVVVNSDSYG